jgi:hypothetical protein
LAELPFLRRTVSRTGCPLRSSKQRADHPSRVLDGAARRVSRSTMCRRHVPPFEDWMVSPPLNHEDAPFDGVINECPGSELYSAEQANSLL